MRLISTVLVCCFLLSQGSPSFACDDSPDLPILPGETSDAFEERFDKTWDDLRVVGRHNAQMEMLGQAATVYIGQVTKRSDSASASGALHQVRVHPVYSVKGKLPAGETTLSDTVLTSCGPKGDGRGTRASEGEWVFVFEGLPKSDWWPNGLGSILARDALADELIAAMWKVGKDPH